MDLKIANKTFLVCGARSGFGKSIALALLNEGANVIGVSRNISEEQSFNEFKDKFIPLNVDLFNIEQHKTIINKIAEFGIDGVLINAGGPPAGMFHEISLEQWDEAYNNVVKWKVNLLHGIIPILKTQKGGNILFLESASIKQPIANLLLSNSLRMAVTGLAKTLSQELVNDNIRVNVIGPGFHNTQAVDRLVKKKAEQETKTEHEMRHIMEQQFPMKKMGNPDNFASLAVWLLSPLSDYVTGQSFFVDGGSIKATL